VAGRKQATARAAALPARTEAPSLARFIPSIRSLLVGMLLVALAVGAYVGALTTSVFAVQRLEITGGTPRIRAAVRRALAPDLGRSLLRIDGADIDQRLAALPDVMSVHYDRSFPHTLRITIRSEHAVLLLRQGSASWVVSTSGRVLRSVSNPRRSSLPRVWVPQSATVAVGSTLNAADGAEAARVLRPLRGTALFGQIRSVKGGASSVTLVRQSGPEIRLGDTTDLALKFAITRRILAVLGPATTEKYVDVSVPERPVAGS
jgi:cell division protein FtsQ